MKNAQLLLMRHGQARPGSAQTDHQRPLTPRGAEDTAGVGSRLKALGRQPTLVFCSDARRTQETWLALEPFLQPVNVQLEGSLYLAGLDQIKERVAKLSLTEHPRLLFIGHNPGWSDTSSALTGKEIELATAEAVLLTVNAASWPEALELSGCWTLVKRFPL